MKHVEVEITRLAKTGEGVGVHDGRSVFVAGTAPGDRVRVALRSESKLLAGDLVELLTAGPSRRTPACAIADQCGGCPWLHVDAATQLAQKHEIVLSALEHVGAVSRSSLTVLPPVASPMAHGARRRAVMHPVSGRLGFHGRRSHQRVVADVCPALTEGLRALPGVLSERLSGYLSDLESVELLEVDGAIALSLQLKGAVKPRQRALAETLVREGVATGVVLVPQGNNPAVLVGEPALSDGQTLLRPDSFAQANAAVNALLVDAALAPLEGAQALELFSGNGNFTVPLARRVGQVLAIESSAVSVALAQSALRSQGLSNVRLMQGDASRLVDGLLAEARRFDVVLLDPPRSGCPGIGAWAHRLQARVVSYVSCDPGSLARDAADLGRNGFAPVSVQAFDMFPQTPHVESLMIFERR